MKTSDILTTIPSTTVYMEEDREVTSIYCCDLLSIVMGRALADSCWITVMGNVNSIAVAVLADISCVLLAEGMTYDEDAINRAKEQGVTILTTELTVYDAAKALGKTFEL